MPLGCHVPGVLPADPADRDEHGAAENATDAADLCLVDVQLASDGLVAAARVLGDELEDSGGEPVARQGGSGGAHAAPELPAQDVEYSSGATVLERDAGVLLGVVLQLVRQPLQPVVGRLERGIVVGQCRVDDEAGEDAPLTLVKG